MRRFVCAAVVVAAQLSSAVDGASVDDFYAGTFTHTTTIVYRLYAPDTSTPGQTFPIVLALHGVGERGDNNTAQLVNGVINWANDRYQTVNPSFVLAPQCPSSETWVDASWSTGVYTLTPSISTSLGTVVALLDSLVGVLPVDTSRQYVTGLSMGGMGTWDLMMRFPQRWAAAVPVCGAVDTTMYTSVSALPIWTYHGSADGVVPPLGTRRTMFNLALDGNPVVFPFCAVGVPSCTELTRPELSAVADTATLLYSELDGVGHSAWNYAYADSVMFRWIFQHSRQPTTVSPDNRPRVSGVCASALVPSKLVDLRGRAFPGAHATRRLPAVHVVERRP